MSWNQSYNKSIRFLHNFFALEEREKKFAAQTASRALSTALSKKPPLLLQSHYLIFHEYINWSLPQAASVVHKENSWDATHYFRALAIVKTLITSATNASVTGGLGNSQGELRITIISVHTL